MNPENRPPQSAFDYRLSRKMAPTTPQSSGVLLAAAELFSGRGRHDAAERKLFGELALNLLPQTAVRDRRRIACLLVRHPQTPQEVLDTLASDSDALTAYPVLKHAPDLPEEILRQQAQAGPDSLRKAIAQRPDLSPAVAMILAAEAGPQVVLCLIDRTDVELTDTMTARLFDRPEILSELGATFADRGLMAPEDLMAQYLWLESPLRTKALAAAELQALVATATGLPRRTPALAAPSPLSAGLTKSVLADDHARFELELARSLGLPLKTARAIIADPSGDAMVIALKALGLDLGSAGSICVRLFGARLDLDQIRGLLRLHNRVSARAAQLLVSAWVAQETLGLKTPTRGHQPLHVGTDRARAPQHRTEPDTAVRETVLPASKKTA